MAAGGRFTRVLLIGDGIATAGEVEAAPLRALAAGLRAAGVQRLDALVDGGIRDEALLGGLVRAGLPEDGVVLDTEQPAAQLAYRMTRATRSGIKVDVPGAAWVWPSG